VTGKVNRTIKITGTLDIDISDNDLFKNLLAPVKGGVIDSTTYHVQDVCKYWGIFTTF
jgi:hypothetical protein